MNRMPRMLDPRRLPYAFKKIDELIQWADNGLRSNQYNTPVFHYAPMSGAEGIIRSNEIWLTHFSFTNDEDEIEHGLNLALGEIRNFLERYPALLSIIEDRLQRAHQPNIYVACFTSKKNSIAQFDRYACNGTGAMIAVNPRAHDHYYVALPNQGPVYGQTNFAEVTYSDKEKIEKIRAYLQKFLPVAIDLFQRKEFYDPIRTSFMLEFAGCLYRLISCFKSSGWEDEAEIRLSVTLLSYEKDPHRRLKLFHAPFLRAGRDGKKEIPYFKSFPVKEDKLLNEFSPDDIQKIRVRIDIPEVLVGPNGDTHRVEAVLNESGYSETKVSKCTTRLRAKNS